MTSIKSQRQASNIRKRSENVRENMFTKQKNNYIAYEAIENNKLTNHSQMVLNKFSS